MVKITGYRNYNYNFELVKQIIENAVTLEKIIIYTMISIQIVKIKVRKIMGSSKKSSLEQHLRTQMSPRVELVML